MYGKITIQLGLLFMAMPFIFSQSGSHVPSFGDHGIQQIDFGRPGSLDDWGEVVKTDAQGRIWIAGGLAGQFGIVRLSNNGKIDSTFNGQGKLQIPVGIFNGDRAYNLFFNPGNKITLVGRSDFGDFSIIRLKSDLTLDSTFSDDGKLLLPVKSGNYNEEELLGSFIDNQGRIVISGGSKAGSSNGNVDFLIVRVNPDGTMDSTFSSDGQLFIPVDSSTDVAYTMTIDSNNKILVAGYSIAQDRKWQMSLIRVDNHGNLDSTFDGDGKKIISLGDESYANDVAVDDHGQILLAGYASWDATGIRKFAIVRLNDDGTPDNTFNENGMALITVGTSYDMGYTMSLEKNGKIIVAGTSGINSVDLDYGIIRLDSNGYTDSSFNNNGRLIIPIGARDDEARSIAPDENGKILVAGWSYNGNNYDISAIRVNEDGTLDNSFNNNGKIIIPSDGMDLARSIIMDAAGKIIVGGSSFNGSSNDFSFTRLNGDGSPDKTFNTNGKAIIPISDQDDPGTNLVLDAKGKLLMAGFSNENYQREFCLVRLNANGSPDSTFDADGKLIIPIMADFSNNTGLALDKLGNILVAGGIDGFYGVIRLKSDGRMDSTFNGDGKKIITDGLRGYANTIAVDSNGKILLAGKTLACSGPECGWDNFQVIRLDSNGNYDSTFSGNGKLIVDFQDPRIKYYIDYTSALNIDQNGRILLAGSSSRQDNIMDNNHWGIGFTRLNYDGSLDTSFQSNGIPLVPVNEQRFTMSNRLFQASGNKILFAGSTDNDFAVLRLNYDGTPDSTFATNGVELPSNGLCYSMYADSNYIWLAGTAGDDYKIVKLFERNNQQIDFTLPDTVNYGDSPIKLGGTASSGLPVSYASSNPVIAFISHDTLVIKGSGWVTITASQDGNGSFYPADPVIRNLQVNSNVTGIPNREPQEEIKTYPNPVTGVLFIECRHKIQSVRITGVEGNLIYEKTNIMDNSFNLEMSGYKPGCYILTINTGDESPGVVRKILKY